MSRTPPVRATVVGAGLMGRWHADAIARIGGSLAWVVDRDASRAAALAARYEGCQATTDFRNAGPVDVVHVCTPLETHPRLARLALEHSHVLVEKPLTETAEETIELLSLAEAHGRLMCPVHQFVFQPGVRSVFASMDRVVPLLHVDLVTCTAGATGYFAKHPDRLIGEITPHPLALLARLFPGGLQDATWQIHHPCEGELRASTCVANVSVGLLVSTRGRPTRNTLRLIGARGTWQADLFHGFAFVEGGATSRARKIAHPFLRGGQVLAAATVNLVGRALRREPAYPGLRELVRKFYLATQGLGPPPLKHEEIVEVARARDALVRQIGTAQPIST